MLWWLCRSAFLSLGDARREEVRELLGRKGFGHIDENLASPLLPKMR